MNNVSSDIVERVFVDEVLWYSSLIAHEPKAKDNNHKTLAGKVKNQFLQVRPPATG